MIRDSLRKLMADGDYLQSKIPSIIETFVAFYGEDKREDITKKLSSVNFIYFRNNETLESNINDVTASIFREAFGVGNEVYIGDGAERLYNVIKDENRYKGISTNMLRIIDPQLKNTAELIDNYKMGKYPKLQAFIQKYEELMPTLAPYKKELNDNRKKEEEIKKKYVDEFLPEISYLIPENLRDGKDISSNLNKVFGNRELVTNSGFAFDDRHEELLNNPKISDTYKKWIKKDRIKYLNACGIVLNNGINEATYEDYLNNPEALSIIKKARIEFEKLSKRSKELYEKQSLEILESNADYQRNKKRIDSFDLENKDIGFGTFEYSSPISCFIPNFKKEGDTYVLSPIVCINAKDNDYTIFHELNHAFEGHIVSVNGDEVEFLSGWDGYMVHIKKDETLYYEKYEGISRDFEFSSEYVNEMNSRLLTELHHILSIEPLLHNRKYMPPSYNVVHFLLKDFYFQFKDIIIESRINGNIAYIKNMLGENNFNELNSLLNEFYNKYGFDLGVPKLLNKAMNDPND